MYKVFFVDDEAAMRAGIRSTMNWDDSGFTLAGEAPDGEMALSLMQDIMPDILITDIKMPFMDGIELAAITKRTMPWVKVIIISGHDEFEYARQAITVGVEEYLLKPVTSKKLFEILNRVAAKIEAEREQTLNIQGISAEGLMPASDTMSGLKYNDVIQRAREFIHKNYGEMNISLHLVAKEVNVSPNHFSAVFSQEIGETFINYLTKVRLEHAKTLLKSTNIRISEIAYEVGYSDTHYFSYVFKKNVGMTPKEFRMSS